MNLDEIQPGMIFKENDRRFNRWIRVLEVQTAPMACVIFIASLTSADGPYELTRHKSWTPERFHRHYASNGYSLIENEMGERTT